MLTKTITKNQYNAIMKNVTNNYNFIYDSTFDYFNILDYDTFINDITNLQITPVNSIIIENALNDITTLNKFKHMFNFQRITLNENHTYYYKMIENDCDILNIENETLLFIDNDVYIDVLHNITVKCTSKLIYNDKRIMTCNVFCNDVTNLVPVYKFVIVAENSYCSYYDLLIFSKSIDIDNINTITGYNIKAQSQLIADIELLEQKLDNLQAELINYNK